jgi:hypothetical protein
VWKRKSELEDINLLEITPVCLAEWEETEDRIVVIRPKPLKPRFAAPLQWFFYLLSAKRIRLDPRSSLVWKCLDGKHTVADVAARLRSEFGESVEPAEERAGHLVRVLRREELVAYPGWDASVSGKRP